MISRSGTRKSSDAKVLAVKQGFDFDQRSAGFSEVFRRLPTSATKDGLDHPSVVTFDPGVPFVADFDLRKNELGNRGNDFGRLVDQRRTAQGRLDGLHL